MSKLFFILTLLLTACSSPAKNHDKEYKHVNGNKSSNIQMASIESHLHEINETLSKLSKTLKEESTNNTQLIKDGLKNLKLLSGKIDFESHQQGFNANELIIPSTTISNALRAIELQLTNISNTLSANNHQAGWEDIIKAFAPIIGGYVLAIWGLMNLATSEARAKMAFINPLIEKSSAAISVAYGKHASNIPLDNSDITNIIEPIVRIKPFLNEMNIVEFIIESNMKTFSLMKMCMPPNIISEINTKDILNIFLNSGQNSSTNSTIRTTLTNQYESAKKDVINHNKKAKSFIVMVFNAIAIIGVPGSLIIYLIANIPNP